MFMYSTSSYCIYSTHTVTVLYNLFTRRTLVIIYTKNRMQHIKQTVHELLLCIDSVHTVQYVDTVDYCTLL